MRTFILAKDGLSPTRSTLLVGPEVEDFAVRSRFYELRQQSVHPSPWLVLELWNHNGLVDRSVCRSFEQPKKDNGKEKR